MGFDNYGRWLYNRSFEIIPNSVFGMKKKDYSHLLSSVEDKKQLINEKLYRMASYKGKHSDFMIVQDAIDLTAHYDSILHFYYDKWDIDWTSFNSINDVKICDVPELTIEMPVGDGRTWFAHVKPFIDSVPSAYSSSYKWAEKGLSVVLYLNTADGLNANCLFSKYKEIAPAFKITVIPGKYYISVGDAYEYSNKLVDMTNESNINISNVINPDSDKAVNTYFSYVSYNVIYAIMYCVHCYNHRATISKPGKHKTSKLHEVRIVQISKDDIKAEPTDKLVDLMTYCSAEKHAYKGGHHSSPVEHDRKGFYRRSRGKGDYDLVDGNFIWVGNKQGYYSYVRSTHVNGVKSVKKTVKVYNVK